MKIPRVSVLSALAALIVITAWSARPAAPKAPDHLLLMVFDQMRPDYIDRFGLEHFKRLRATSRHYPEAFVGHLGSQTVVAHVVIPTGLRPGALPWVDDVLVDSDGAIGPAGAAYKTGDLKREQMWQLLRKIPREQFLPARIQDALGGRVVAIGEKDYAADLIGGPYASVIVTMGRVEDSHCKPDGVNVPDYIASNQRFTVDCTRTYGTGAGNHEDPGPQTGALVIDSEMKRCNTQFVASRQSGRPMVDH